MKSLVYTGPENLKMIDTSKPTIKSDEVLINVKYCGICGSDVKIYKGKHPRVKEGTILGHEFIGQIEKINDDNLEFTKGDFVAVEPLNHCHNCSFCKTGRYNLCEEFKVLGTDTHGGFSEFVKVPADKIYKIDSSNLKKMVLVEPLAVAVNAVNNIDITIEDSTVVLGAGTIGLLTAQVLRNNGANVIISEINKFRLEIADKLGFETVNPKKENIEKIVKTSFNENADIVIDTVGLAPAFKTALQLVKKGGVINIIGIYSKKPNIPLQKMVYSELTITGSFIYTYPEFKIAVNLLKNNKIQTKPLITDVFSLEEAVKGFEKMKKGENCLKILIEI